MNCKTCGQELPLSHKPNLSGLCFKCRKIASKSSNNPEQKAWQAAYRARNREKRLIEKKTWYQANKVHKLQKDKENKAKNLPAFRNRQNKYWKNRYHTDVNYKLRKILRHSLRRGIFEGNKSILEYMDCSLEEVKQHLESLFTKEMSWDNHGTVWDIDHIRPLCSFDLTKESEIKLATCKNNLQPLTKKANLLKSKEDRLWIQKS